MKYDLTFKKAVIAYFTKGHSYLATANHFSIDKSDVKKWVDQFNYGGADAITPKQGKSKFTAEFKHLVITTMLEEKLSLNQTALRFGISSPSLISTWHRILLSDGMLGLVPKPKGRATMSANKKKYIVDKPDSQKTSAELQLELQYLRAENAYLKKLDALLKEQTKPKK